MIKSKKQLSEERQARRNAKLAAEKTRLINLQADKEYAEWLKATREHCLNMTKLLYRLNVNPRIHWSMFKGQLYKNWVTESKYE